jgi:hypothetical protein
MGASRLRRVGRPLRIAAFGGAWFAFALLIAGALPVAAQEMEARSYSASPIDTNFALGVFSTSSGDVSLDPSLPLTDVHAAVNTTTLEFS